MRGNKSEDKINKVKEGAVRRGRQKAGGGREIDEGGAEGDDKIKLLY
jgi:hypothetical protein